MIALIFSDSKLWWWSTNEIGGGSSHWSNLTDRTDLSDKRSCRGWKDRDDNSWRENVKRVLAEMSKVSKVLVVRGGRGVDSCSYVVEFGERRDEAR